MGIAIFDSTAECMAQSPVANDGRGIFVGGTEATRRELNLVSPIEVDRVYVQLWKGADRKLRDCIASSAHDPVISHQLYDLIQRFRIDDSIRFLPADILTWQHTKVDQYLYGYSTAEHDILDYDRAKYKTVRGVSGDPVVIEIQKWVAVASRIPPYDLFCSAPLTRWIVSDRLQESIITHGITGCRFHDVAISIPT
jgi:hypothetical protein